MKIQINHINNTYNYGSLMMAINIIKKLELANVEIYVDVDTWKDLERLKMETRIETIYFQEKYLDINNYNKFIKEYIKQKRDSKKYDKTIILGGDDISEYYGKRALIKILFSIYLISLKREIYLLGQTIGPFSGYRKILAKYILNRTNIYTRDDRCLVYLNSIGIKNAKRGRDLAFHELPNNNTNKILMKYNLQKDSYITIVPSGLVNCYTNSYDDYCSSQISIIRCLCNNEKLKYQSIVLLPHVIVPRQVDDRIVINKIFSKLDQRQKKRIVKIEDEMLASEAREILGNGLFTITGRMHAAVSTFYMRKPAISLSYSVKYAGIIGDGLDMNELVIESADEKLWSNGEISKLVDEKVNYVLDNYDELIKKIDLKVLETSKIVEDQLDDVVNIIKNTVVN